MVNSAQLIVEFWDALTVECLNNDVKAATRKSDGLCTFKMTEIAIYIMRLANFQNHTTHRFLPT